LNKASGLPIIGSEVIYALSTFKNGKAPEEDNLHGSAHTNEYWKALPMI